jgi:methyl-accepting chemotaxis protein
MQDFSIVYLVIYTFPALFFTERFFSWWRKSKNLTPSLLSILGILVCVLNVIAVWRTEYFLIMTSGVYTLFFLYGFVYVYWYKSDNDPMMFGFMIYGAVNVARLIYTQVVVKLTNFPQLKPLAVILLVSVAAGALLTSLLFSLINDIRKLLQDRALQNILNKKEPFHRKVNKMSEYMHKNNDEIKKLLSKSEKLQENSPEISDRYLDRANKELTALEENIEKFEKKYKKELNQMDGNTSENNKIDRD